MRCESVSLQKELEAVGPGIVCLTGGGGKTTLLYALGVGMAEAGNRVLCTTTTKMYRPRPMVRLPAVFESDPAALLPPRGGAVFAARPGPPGCGGDKVYGYSAAEVDALFRRGFAPWILVEADGAAGRPVKAPAEHEPVIPAGTAVVIGVIGLCCLSRPFTTELAFRAERFSAVTGLAPGDPVTPEAVATLVLHPDGLFKNSPGTSARLLFCNQSDLPGAVEAGGAVAEAVFSRNASFLRGAYLGAARAEGLKCRKLIPD
jgi:probable selenium-dependent hydroxylase accessory protein YqeC